MSLLISYFEISLQSSFKMLMKHSITFCSYLCHKLKTINNETVSINTSTFISCISSICLLLHSLTMIVIKLITIIIFLTLVLNSQGRKIMLCKDKIRKQAGMVVTPPPPSQNYQEVE